MKPRHVIISIIVLLVLAAIPQYADNYFLRIATTMFMYAILAMSWNFIGGFAGYPSFGTAAFFGIGAYAATLTQINGMPPFLAWAFAGLVAGALGLLLGLALLRLRGHAFAIATLIVAEVLREIANSWTNFTGGGMGLNLPFSTLTPEQAAAYFYYVMFAVCAITFICMLLTARSKLGFGLRCIKQNEDAANMVGVNTTLYKTLGFALSGVFAGMAGGVYASLTGYIEPADVFDIMITIKAIVMALLGGVGTIFGPIIGAVAFLVIDEFVWQNFLEFHTGALGIIVVLLVLFLPLGLASIGKYSILGRRASK
ncbi:MAG: branched-chain amino acid ABC transporter permease [Pusillimonas sp.]|nr:branched-chain amino acid ABC transporter permease [Pusillimonas sp.]